MAVSPIDGPGKPINDSTLGWIYHEPIVLTQWGQGAPYDAYTPICYEGDWGNNPHGPHHHLIGCVAVALGQFLAQQGYIYTAADGRLFNLGSFAQTPTPTSSQEDDLAFVLKDLSDRLNIRYKSCWESVCWPNNWKTLLKDLGYSYSIKNEINTKEFKNFIASGKPILVNGYNSEGGHMWILDGIYGTIYEPYYHCNWGWSGTCNGWMLSTPLIGYDETAEEGKNYTYYTQDPSYYFCEK